MNVPSLPRGVRWSFVLALVPWLTFAPVIPPAYAQTAVIVGPQDSKNIARQRGWILRRESPQFGTIELQRIVNGIPLYYKTVNADAADTVSTDECLPAGSSGLGLTGAGAQIAIWDAAGVRLSHTEFGGRAVQLDGPVLLSNHATHVAGTMIAAGASPAAMGMAPTAMLDCFDWNDDLVEMAVEAANGVRVSNHSYGYIAGWHFEWSSGDWYWFGDIDVNATEDYFFGFYDEFARQWDELAVQHPHLLFVVAAGNDRDQGPQPGAGHWAFDTNLQDWTWSTTARNVDGNAGYDSLSHIALAKNGLSVGAVEDIPGGYSGANSVIMTSFSCWGPCDDGRLKPDIVANGSSLFSTSSTGDSSYDVLTGTSMATPNTSGSLALLLEHYRETHPAEPDMLSATIKCLLVHTADEAGPGAGPDYKHGWGLLNTLRAAEHVTADMSESLTISEQSIVVDSEFELFATTTAASPELRVSIAWTDPPAPPVSPAVDPTASMLINDLDLRVEEFPVGTTYFPWVLDPMDPGAPATPGDNNVDNIEQVAITAPGDRTFAIRITADGPLFGDQQAFSLVITGASEILFDCNQNGVSDVQDIGAGTSNDCNTNTVPDECDIEGPSNDCNLNTIPDECEFTDCNANCVPDSQDINRGLSTDCNSNLVPDECDVESDQFDDCNLNALPDTCDLSGGNSMDCNSNGVPDECDIVERTSQDCDRSSIPDECEIAAGLLEDCNENVIPDMCDLIYGTSLDCNTNSIPDECEFADCNQNCIPDESDIASETSPDCNDNFVPDECDIVSGYSHDNTANGIPDDCENLELVGFEAALVTRANRPAVGATGYLEDLNATPVINNNRIVALWATTTQGQEILYTWSRDEGLLPQVRQGDESPIIGVTFDMIWKPLSINDSSEVAFSAELSAAPGRGVFVVSDAAVDTIAVQGDLVSDLGGVVDFGFNETDSGQASAPVGAAILSTGDVVFRGNLNGAANGLGQSGAIFLHSGGLITALAASGMSVPTLGIIDVIQQGPWASPDGVVTFRARANGIDRILRYYNGELHVIARTGNCAPGTPTVFMQFDDPVTSAGPVETYFSATISGFPGNGIFKRRFDGTINDLVVEGDPTPVGGSFIRPRSVLGNPLGNLFYYSEISGAGPASGIFTYTQRTTTSAAVLLAGADAPAAGGLEVDDPGSFAINSVGDMVVQYKATDGFRRIVLLDRHLVGDLDLDDDVDIVDFDTFVECMAGPGVTGGALCIEADFDGDADIDMDDFGVMQDAFIICEQSGADCNGNGVGDECDLEGEIATDCDDNGVLDECDILLGFAIDCNSNLLNDSCDITTGSSVDFNANAVPDECEGFEDCNLNAIGDQFDLSMGTSLDCDGNLEPDECQLLDGPPVLVGADAGTVVRIRPTDPAESHIANIGIPDIRGMAASCDSTIWAVSSSGDVGTIDPLLGTFSFLAANPLFIWDAAAFDCATGILYAKATVSPGMENTLYRISTIDGSPEPVGYIGAIRGLAFDSLNNTLYGFGNGILYEIDPETGCSNILCDNLISSALQTLAFGDGHLYVTSTSTVYEIAPTTCNATAIGTIGSPLDSTTALTYTYDTSDCNDNGIPDNCDLDSGTSEDLNGDSVPDECEGADCNANNVPDVQELLLQISLMSEVFSPFGHGFPANYTIPASPFTTGSVAFRYDVLADLGSPDESVDISIAGPEGAFARSDVWQTTGVNCPVGGGWLVDDVSGTVFNENIAGADTAITVTASATVDPFECVDDTFLKITIQYVADNDCNENGIPDECDIQFGGSTDCEPNGIPDDCEPDCNGNLVADLCDILNGTSVDCQGNGIPDECETDCNGNAIDDSCDIATGTSDDCNLNDVPDECESDCNANGIADSCDIAIGPSEDCNVNTVPDECDIMDGTSEDADGSGVPDECEVPPPMLLWADVWGQRIERVFLDGLQRVEITQTKVPRGLLVHPESLKLYWTENAEGGMLARVNLDGTGMQTLATNLTTNLDGLALDVQSQRLFFCDSLSGGAGAILSIALNGTDLQTVLGNQEEPKDIQIPQGGGKMYWLADDREFRRASLDGSAEELMFSVTGSVRKFALDVADNRIYWTTGGSLMRSQLDGTQQEVVIGFGVPDGVTLDSGAARLYWSDFDDTKIRRATLSGQAIEEFVTMGIERALILRLYPENGSAFEDCNANNIPDATDIANATSEDCNTNLVPDECEVDCSGNQIPDECDIQSGVEQDCNGNDVPDSCDLESGTSHDDDGSGVPDECEGDLDPNLSYSYAKIGPAGAAAIAINDSGHVAYWSDDGLHIQTDTEDILKVGSAGFDTIGTNTIRLSNADHVVLFGRRDSSSEFELLRVEPSQVAADIAEFTVVADASGFPFTSIARIGGVPASGEVPFGADGPPVATTFVGDGSGDIHNIDSFAQPFPDTLFGPVSSTIPPLLNENELIVTAFDVASIPAIIGLQGALPPDPTINDYIIFNLFSETGYGVPRAMAVGNSGKVAFVSANPPRDLVLADGAVQEILATDVSGAQVIDINSNDEVLFFRGDIGSGGTSLILTDGLVEVPVLTASDEVDGLTVIGIELPQRSINDARQVLLNLLYDEGNGVERAAYLATPNP